MSAIPQDIFSEIILSSLDVDALDTLKNLSQVSQAWRTLALSPVLWAKALDFKELRPKKDVWRSEVLRRTGNSTLRVSGSWIPSVIQEFFLHEFLVPNMHRIKTLHAHIGLMTNKIARDPAWSIIFDQPAPVLATFSLDFDEDHKQDAPRVIRDALRDGKALFAGSAPALRTVKNDPFLMLNPGAHPNPDWMSNLTTIMLSADPKTVLAILTQTPRLERLFLKGRGHETLDLPEVTSITLPHLRYIYKGQYYPESHFGEIRQAIQAPPGISVFAAFRAEESVPTVAGLFREYIRKEKPQKLLLRLPEFRLCNISLGSRRAAMDEVFRDADGTDFAIDIDSIIKPYAFMEAVISEEIECSSVQEWHLRFKYSSYSRVDERTSASLKAFFEKALWPDQILVTDKDCFEDLQKHDVIPKTQPSRITKKRENQRWRRMMGDPDSGSDSENETGNTFWNRS